MTKKTENSTARRPMAYHEAYVANIPSTLEGYGRRPMRPTDRRRCRPAPVMNCAHICRPVYYCRNMLTEAALFNMAAPAVLSLIRFSMPAADTPRNNITRIMATAIRGYSTEKKRDLSAKAPAPYADFEAARAALFAAANEAAAEQIAIEKEAKAAADKNHTAVEKSRKASRNKVAEAFIEAHKNGYTIEDIAALEAAAEGLLTKTAAAYLAKAEAAAEAAEKLTAATKPHLIRYWQTETAARKAEAAALKKAHSAALTALRQTSRAAAYLRNNLKLFQQPISAENLMFFAAYVVSRKAKDFNGNYTIARAWSRVDRLKGEAAEAEAAEAAVKLCGTDSQKAAAAAKVDRYKKRVSAATAAAQNAGKRGFYGLNRAAAVRRSALKRMAQYNANGYISLGDNGIGDDAIMDVVCAAYDADIMGKLFKDAAAVLYRAAHDSIYNAYASIHSAPDALGKSFDEGFNSDDDNGAGKLLAAEATFATAGKADESIYTDSEALIWDVLVSLFDEAWSDEVWVGFAYLSAGYSTAKAARLLNVPRTTLIDKLTAARAAAREAMPEAVEYLREGQQYADYWLKVVC